MQKNHTYYSRFCVTILLVLFFSIQLKGQKEANIWYFGNKAGINFNDSVPYALTDGQMVTQEGCASIADTDGNLLFYTDGVSVWNKSHAKMPNGFGLMGNSSSTQSGIIVPQPGSNSIYYIFTISQSAQIEGLRYSRVNMNLAGGLGDVEVFKKNTPVLSPVPEKIAATMHANGRDIWLITHGWGNNSFYVFILTDTGLINIPVVSSTGIFHGGISSSTLGQLKVSNDGAKIVLCNSYINKTQLFDFDISTGIVSNPVTFPNHYSNYGCEFSPDRSRLYISQLDSSSIYQYDLSSNDSATIVNTGVLLSSHNAVVFGSLQLAPDGKIYMATSQSFLSTINKPNEAGVECEFKLDGLDLAGKLSIWGLPNFISNYMYKVGFEAENFCLNNETCFEYIEGHFDSLMWDFKDGSALVTSHEKRICHKYEDSGTYEVKLYVWYLGLKYIAIKSVLINPRKYSFVSVSICEGDSFFLQGEYRNGAGIYFDTIFNGSYQGCDSIIETSLTVFSKVISLADINICLSDSVFLEGRFQTEEGVYYDTMFNGSSNGCDSVVITNLFHTVPEVIIKSFNECQGFSITVGASTYDQTGIYKDIVNGCDTIITHLNIYDTPAFYFSSTEDTCNAGKGSIVGRVFSGKPPYTYFWNNGSTDSVISGLKSGIYSLTVFDSNGCISTDTTEVMNLNRNCDLSFFVPTAFSPNEDGSNDVFRVIGQHISKVNVQILNRWGEEIFKSTDIDFAWDGTYMGQPCQDGIYTVVIHYETILEPGKAFLFRGTLHLMR